MAAFLLLGLLERGHAVADGLHPGQRRAAGGERAQQHEEQGQAAELLGRLDLVVRALGLQVMAGAQADQAPADHQGDHADEAVGGDRERRAGFADTAQVDQRDGGHHQNGDQRDVAVHGRERRGQVGHPGRHRHRHGQHVVDHQRAGHHQPHGLPEVRARHLVVAAAGRVGVHVLPVGRDHDQHQEGDPGGDPGRVGEQRKPADRQHEQDFLGGVGHGGQRVAGENRQRDLLRKQRVTEAVALHRTADQHALDDPEPYRHVRMLARPRSALTGRSCSLDHRDWPGGENITT